MWGPSQISRPEAPRFHDLLPLLRCCCQHQCYFLRSQGETGQCFRNLISRKSHCIRRVSLACVRFQIERCRREDISMRIRISAGMTWFRRAWTLPPEPPPPSWGCDLRGAGQDAHGPEFLGEAGKRLFIFLSGHDTVSQK